jgi:hypothetical protein
MAEMKIVKIIDDNQVVVNGGKNQNIKRGDVLEIYKSGGSISDPETGEDLGTLDYVKAIIKVVTPYEKMSLCESAETKLGLTMATALSNFNGMTVPLQVDMKQISGGLDDSDKTVRIGDLVRKA